MFTRGEARAVVSGAFGRGVGEQLVVNQTDSSRLYGNATQNWISQGFVQIGVVGVPGSIQCVLFNPYMGPVTLPLVNLPEAKGVYKVAIDLVADSTGLPCRTDTWFHGNPKPEQYASVISVR